MDRLRLLKERLEIGSGIPYPVRGVFTVKQMLKLYDLQKCEKERPEAVACYLPDLRGCFAIAESGSDVTIAILRRFDDMEKKREPSTLLITLMQVIGIILTTESSV